MGSRARVLISFAALAAAACAPGGGGSTPNFGEDLPPELVFSRVHVDQARLDEIVQRTAQNLGTRTVRDRSGREMHARLHPAGDRVVFARERSPNNPDSRELFVAGLGTAIPETRLTQNSRIDDAPCWSPAGDRVLYSTTRDGDRRLYVTAADGSDVGPFLAAAPGVQDGDPDWHAGTDRVVFSRREASGLRRLYLVQGNGTGLVPLTVGAPATTDDTGDHHPAFRPDGARVLFVRNTGDSDGRLLEVEVATGIERELFAPRGPGGGRGAGAVAHPRWSPAADRIFLGLAEPDLGRQGLRLAVIGADGSDPLLVEPGEQWQVFGVDVLPGMAAPPAAEPIEVVSIDGAQVQLSSGLVVQGNKEQLRAADGQSLVLVTQTFGDHEIASVNVVFSLPVAPADVLALHATITGNVTRADGDTTLRTSVHNPVAERFDTLAELPMTTTARHTITFETQSLAHVSREGLIRIQAIAEIGAGARAEFHIDHVGLQLVRRTPDAPTARR